MEIFYLLAIFFVPISLMLYLGVIKKIRFKKWLKEFDSNLTEYDLFQVCEDTGNYKFPDSVTNSIMGEGGSSIDALYEGDKYSIAMVTFGIASALLRELYVVIILNDDINKSGVYGNGVVKRTVLSDGKVKIKHRKLDFIDRFGIGEFSSEIEVVKDLAYLYIRKDVIEKREAKNKLRKLLQRI
ncbi:MAG: hypothetical protein ACI8SR_000448 [Oceanicoccus sp.]|jgi:hypothetical protein